MRHVVFAAALLSAVAAGVDLDARSRPQGSQAPVDREDQDALTPLMRASATGDLAALNALLGNGADPNARNSTQRITALMCAAFFGRLEAAKVLIAKGARIELKDANAAAAIDWAAQGNHVELEDILTGSTVALNPFLITGNMAFWLMDKAAAKPQR